ncbi:hypothetical protein CHS0354_031943 [Potamilus streckersoni]|uniref:Uncharacterized protein n=1 Tax=Potamilus streckersoni TaxID=2493646 RepID=A0AAE0VNV3_9BIVA|nr:hypothetical protein CHS0354_031943 [Potamilus streckersoni]
MAVCPIAPNKAVYLIDPNKERNIEQTFQGNWLKQMSSGSWIPAPCQWNVGRLSILTSSDSSVPQVLKIFQCQQHYTRLLTMTEQKRKSSTQTFQMGRRQITTNIGLTASFGTKHNVQSRFGWVLVGEN